MLRDHQCGLDWNGTHLKAAWCSSLYVTSYGDNMPEAASLYDVVGSLYCLCIGQSCWHRQFLLVCRCTSYSCAVTVAGLNWSRRCINRITWSSCSVVALGLPDLGRSLTLPVNLNLTLCKYCACTAVKCRTGISCGHASCKHIALPLF